MPCGYRRYKPAEVRPVLVFIFVAFSAPLAYVAVGGLVAASVLNVIARRHAHAG